MTQENKGKSVFQRAMESLSNRDEKEAVEAAMKRSEELEKQVADLQQQNAKLTQELNTAKSDLITARNTLRVNEIKLQTTNSELQKYVNADQAKSIAAAAAAAEKSNFIAEHKLKDDETLSHLALKYYGSAYEPYWRVIYDANKETIGDNPGRVRPGMVINIPPLPDDLKK